MGNTPESRSSLLLRLRDPRDRDAWDEFAVIYTPLIHRYCLRRGLQEADAADVAQDAMFVVSQAIARFELRHVKGSFRSWLFKITRSALADLCKRQRREPPAEGGTTLQRLIEDHPDPAIDDLWDREYQQYMFDWACQQARSEFEESTWQAFWCTAVKNLKGETVAQSLGISLGAVYIAKSRVLARLKQLVGGVSDDSPFLEGH